LGLPSWKGIRSGEFECHFCDPLVWIRWCQPMEPGLDDSRCQLYLRSYDFHRRFSCQRFAVHCCRYSDRLPKSSRQSINPMDINFLFLPVCGLVIHPFAGIDISVPFLDSYFRDRPLPVCAFTGGRGDDTLEYDRLPSKSGGFFPSYIFFGS